MIQRLWRLAIVAALAAVSSAVHAAPPSRHTDPPTAEPADGAATAVPKLRYDLRLDLPITIAGAAFAVSAELLASRIAPEACRWCDSDSNGHDTLNDFDAYARQHLRWSNPAHAGIVSDILSYAVAPAAGLGLASYMAYRAPERSNLPIDLLIVFEAAVIAVDVNQAFKLSVARRRPDIHARLEADPNSPRSTGDNLSFYSGHTTFAFALAAAGGTVATMRKHPLAPWVWATGMTLAAATGYLRVAADRHYASDVLVGALLGTSIGVGIPLLFHSPVVNKTRLSALPSAGGATLVWSGTW